MDVPKISVSALCWVMTVPFFGFGRLKKGTLSLDPAFFNLQDSIILGSG